MQAPGWPARGQALVDASEPRSQLHRLRLQIAEPVLTRGLSLTAVYETVDGGWVQARIKELPPVITAAPALGEAKELLLDALQEFLLSLGASETAPSRDADTARFETLTIQLTASG